MSLVHQYVIPGLLLFAAVPQITAYAHRVTLGDVDSAVEKLAPFLSALECVESNSRDDAVGDNGKALGRLQVWEVYWQDAVAHCPEIGGRYTDVTDATYARRTVAAYLLRYAHKAVDASDYETLARVHNGGPRGAKRKATLIYWHRVEKVLRQAEVRRGA
jgi:hypothetical protein